MAPGIGWQDLRTVGTCLVLQAEGIRLAPNASATKVMAILDEVDPERARAERGELCFGTVDSWVAWTLSGGAAAGAGALHVTDATNAAVTGLVDATIGWDEALLQKLRIPSAMLPVIVDSSGDRRAAPRPCPARRPSAGSPETSRPPSSVRAAPCPGMAKATFGTGGMLDQCVGPGGAPGATEPGRRGHVPDRRLPRRGASRPGAPRRSCSRPAPASNGCATTSGSSPPRQESADGGGPVRDRRATSGSSRRCSVSGRRCGTSAPAGTLVGLTRGSGRPEIVRAVLEGVAHRGADLVEASERDSGFPIAALRIDGGMTDNDVFVQALADAIGRPVEISPVLEATTLGAGLLAGLAVGTYATTERAGRDVLASPDGGAPGQPTPTGSPRVSAGWRPAQGRGHHPGALGHLLLREFSPAPEGDLATRVTPFPAICSLERYAEGRALR